jgi:hypothetical protein
MTIFRRNNLNIGIGLGTLLPLGVSFLLLGIITAFDLPFKTRTAALVGICANIYTLRSFQSNRANQSVRGVVIATVVLAGLWFVWFYEEIIAELGR